MENIIPLWRNRSVHPSKHKKSDIFIKNIIFPSARQAITFSIRHSGLSRKDRIAFPEWSSNCVLSAIGKISTPIPIKEVLEKDIDVSGVLLYDQWGWPTINNSKKSIKEKFKNKILFLDQVDTINKSLKLDNLSFSHFFEKTYNIFSFSKTIGLDGGGIVNDSKNWLKNVNTVNHNEIVKILDEKFLDKKNVNIVSDFLKSEIKCLNSKTNLWIENYNLLEAFKSELFKRRKNFILLKNSEICNDWSNWMTSINVEKNPPGIVPLFSNLDYNQLQKIKDEILKKFSIETQIYHFDYNGNQLYPNYKKCLAFPIHGMVDVESAISNLVNLDQ